MLLTDSLGTDVINCILIISFVLVWFFLDDYLEQQEANEKKEKEEKERNNENYERRK